LPFRTPKITKKIFLSLRELAGGKVDKTRLNQFEFASYSGVRGRNFGAERPAVEISYFWIQEKEFFCTDEYTHQ